MNVILLLTGLFAALLAAEMTTVAFPFVVRIAKAIRAMDYPGGRRSQKDAIPRLGGIAIAAGIAAGGILPNFLLWRALGGEGEAPRYGGVVGGGKHRVLGCGGGRWAGGSSDK